MKDKWLLDAAAAIIAASVIAVCAAGCGSNPPPPTATSEPTLTPPPTATVTPAPTATPAPTTTPEPAATPDPALASSDFDNGVDGWSVSRAKDPVHWPEGGNPGGYVSATDAGSGDWYWLAPAKFLGDKSAAYGGVLTFDLKQARTDKQYAADDVILVGEGIRLVFRADSNPGTSWTSFTVPLVESVWQNTKTRQAATREELLQALSTLSELRIRGEFVKGVLDVCGLDNVRLLKP